MTKADRQAKASAQFCADVVAMARQAGGQIVPSNLGDGREEFVLSSPIGELRGGALYDSMIYMRFTNPGHANPAVDLDQFNPHSHKWNIDGYGDTPEGQKAALERFAYRLEWVTGARAPAATA